MVRVRVRVAPIFIITLISGEGRERTVKKRKTTNARNNHGL